MIIIFIFRRIELKDDNLKFLSGQKAFNNINPSGTLKEYLNQDLLKGGVYKSFILIEKNKNIIDILGLLRFSTVELTNFKDDLYNENISQEIIQKLIDEIENKKSKIIYLSRIGIKENHQRIGIGTIISSFFEFIIKKEEINCIVYSKVLKQALNLFHSADVLKLNYSEEWKEDYYLILKSYYF